MPETKIILTADARGVQAGARQAVSSLQDVEKALGKLQSLSAKALSFAGLGFGGAELIQLADQYGAITSRLQLATQYTGDFAQVQAALRQAADDTRAPLQETVELYTKLSPALQGLGKNGTQSVGIIATINKAIALSGASSEASAASMLQFSQALGSGVLRGDELNSILEQTPSLADAIAQGLGVTRGELRKLGEEGKLSSVAVIQALEKVRERVDADFAKMPITVSQSLTYLTNALTDVIGGSSQATGAMAGLSRAIVQVADGIKAFSGSSETLRPLVEFLMDAVDGFARVARIGSGTFAALFAAKDQFFENGLSSAKAVLEAWAEDVGKIIDEPWSAEKRQKAIVASETDIARQRLALEKNLSDEVQKLENMRAFIAGKASESILKDDKARTDEQIKNAERLRDALAGAWESTRKDIETTRKEIDSLLAKAAAIRQNAADKIADRQNKNLTPEQQDNNTFADFRKAADSASFNKAVADAARLDGRTEVARKAAEQAAKDAERAVKLADKLADDNLAARAIQEAADLQAKLIESQAASKQKEQADLEARAASQAEMLTKLDAQLEELRKKAATLQVQADVTQAEAKITGLKAQLDALGDKTITVTVNTVGSQAALDAAAANAADPAQKNFAWGGYTGPGGKYQPAGIVHAGEFVVRQEIVRQRGVLDFLARLNRGVVGSFPGFANGGLVSRMVTPSLSSARAGSSPTPMNLFLDGRRYPVAAAPDVAAQLASHLSREALKRGGKA